MQGEFVELCFSSSLDKIGSCASALRIVGRLACPSFECQRSQEFLSILNLLRAEETTRASLGIMAGRCFIRAIVLVDRAAAITSILSLLRLPPGEAPVVTS